MSVVLACCSNDQPYLGMDPDCTQDALICLQHSPHANAKGIFHNIIPVAQFRTTINEMKYQMADKVGTLTDQYSQFMDQLTEEIQSLKIRKVTELGTLWLRELASTEEEYEQLKRIFRNDLSGFCCKEIHSFYRKVTQTQDLQKQSLQKIPAYSEICKVMNGLTSSPRARMLITQKITNLQGILEKGQLLKRALPDRKLFKQNTKEILLEAANPKHFDIRYNRVQLKTSSSNYQSIFSKYPLLSHTNYHLLINCKYTNIILGVCHGQIKNKTSEKADLHYNQHSLTYNCSNGCIYRDGMFESGTTNLTKGQKELQLVLHLTQTEMILLIGSRVICRVGLQKADSPVYLHLLMRTLGDSVEIDRDQGQFANFSSQIDATDTGQAKRDGPLGPSPSLADYLKSTKKQTPVINESGYEFQKDAKKVRFQPELIESRPTFGNQSDNLMQNSPVYESVLEPKINGPLFQSIEQRLPANLPLFARNDKSSVIINMESSVYGSDPNSQKYNAGSEVYKRSEGEKLLSPVEIKLEKSQFQSELRSNNYLSNFQSIKLTGKDISGLDGLRKTEYDSEWL